MKKTMIRIASLALALVLLAGMIPSNAFAKELEPYGPLFMCNPAKAAPVSGTIAAGNYHSVRLNNDGTAYAAGSTALSEEDNRGTRCDVWYWEDIVQVSTSSHTVGVKADGTAVAVGCNKYGQCNVDGWKDILAADAGNKHTVGLKADGTVVAVGDNSYGQCDVYRWKNIVQVEAGEDTTYGLTADGRILSAGKRNYGAGWSKVTAISAGAYHLVALKEDGTVVQTGGCDNWDRGTDAWGGIVAISAGGAFTLGLRADGTVVAVGSETADKGQCDVNGWYDIVAISAGMHHALGLKADGTVVAVGSNGYNQCDIAG